MNSLLSKLSSSPIVPVYYNDDIEVCKSVVRQCYEGGVRIFEFVDRGNKSNENFKKLVDFKNQYYSDLMLGIGTIKTVEQAKTFINIGADFLVSPIIDIDIFKIAQDNSIEWIPGCMTPTEIALAEKWGISIVKIFPGDVLGVNFVKAVKPLFPSLNFMVTGGVALSKVNLEGWFNAGVKAVGVGSKLFDGDFSTDKDVTQNLKHSLDFIRSL